MIYNSAQALLTFQKLYGLFPRIIGKGDYASVRSDRSNVFGSILLTPDSPATCSPPGSTFTTRPHRLHTRDIDVALGQARLLDHSRSMCGHDHPVADTVDVRRTHR